MTEQLQVSFDHDGALNQMSVQGAFTVNVTTEAAARNRILTSLSGDLQYSVFYPTFTLFYRRIRILIKRCSP